jgi:hypothetical protein
MENTSLPINLELPRKSWLKTLLFLTIILSVSFLAILPIYLYGIPNGNDFNQHYQFAASIDEAIQSGDFYPNWAMNENNGYGGIGLRFYPPISYYVLAFGKIILGNWYHASVAAFTFWMFLGGIGIYLWSREFFSDRSSLFAGCLYIFVPYHLIELYSSFTYAEYAACGVLPFCFLFVTRICKKANQLDVIFLAVSYAVLILTHLPLTVIGSISLAIFMLASSRFNFRKLIFCGSGIILGLALSIFHWIRIVTEMQWVNHSSEAYSASGKEMYDFHNHFLLSFPYVFGLDNDINNLWFADLAIVATLLICLPFVVVIYRSGEKQLRNNFFPIIVVFVLAFLMMTKISLPIWENISVLQKVQFPWRWFSIVSIFSVMFAACGFESCIGYLKTEKRSQALLAFICVIFCVVFTWTQVIRQANQLEINDFAEKVKSVGSGSNCECWLPVWASKHFSEPNEKVVAANRKVKTLFWQRLNKTVEIESGNATNVRFALLYYPYWKAKINGKETEIVRTSDGTVSLDLDESFAIVEVAFIEPPAVKNAALVSKISWILLTFTALFLLWKTLLKSKI